MPVRPFAGFPSRMLASMLALCAALASSLASATPAPLQDYFREVWTTREGLPHNTINAMAQTPDGYLWFATWEGPARFNGREFEVFDRPTNLGLPDAGLRTLALDRSGGLMVGGARGGLARRVETGWQGLEPAAGLVVALHEDRTGRLWVGTEANGLLRIDPDGGRIAYAPQRDLPASGVQAILEDGLGRVWFASTAGLLLLDGERLRAAPPDAGLPAAPVTALAVDGAGRLLVGTERGAFRARADAGFEPLAAELADDAVSQLLVDADGSIWVGTVYAGLVRLSARGVERFGVAEGLPNSRVLSLLRDREDSLWIGTNGGLLRLRDAPMSSHTRQRGLASDFVRSVLAHSDGSLWVGTSEGLNRFGPGGIERIGLGTELERESVLSLAEAGNGDVWIGSFARGLWRWRDGALVEHIDRTHGLPANEVRAIVETDQGTLWIGTALGAARRDANGLTTFDETSGLPGNFVLSLLARANGEVWIGTGAGIAIHDGKGLRTLPLERVGAAYAFALREDRPRGAVWIGSDRGLIRYRQRDGALGVVGRDAGLPFEKLFSVTFDHEDHIWLSGNRGVLRIRRDEAEAVVEGRQARLAVERFTESDGMASSQCNGGSGPAAALRPDGSVWFATAGGIAAVRPERLSQFAEHAPPAVIERIAVDGREVPVQDGLRLGPGSNRVEIDFAGLGFVMPQRIRYRYRLDGFDADWVERGTQSTAELTNLPPGEYRFRVQAAYPQGRWSESEASWRFSVAPRLWQRAEVQALGLFAIVALVLLVIRLRLRQLRQREIQLSALVEQRTADLNRQTERLLAADAERSALLERLREQSEAFERQAHEDTLTGLANRRAFDARLAEAVAGARCSGRPLCLAVVDIDHFKAINDRWSHAAGDEALKAVAHTLRETARASDTVARWGGEEFALLLPDTELDAALALCERLRLAVQAIDCVGFAPGLRLSVSIGLAGDAGFGHHERLLSRADAALYRAKQEGRNRVCTEQSSTE